MSRFNLHRVPHLVFIALCFVVVGVRHFVISPSARIPFVGERARDEVVVDSGEMRDAEPDTRPDLRGEGGAASDVSHHDDDWVDALMDDEALKETLPIPVLAAARLSQLDREAKQLIEAGDMPGLVSLKLRAAETVPSTLRAAFLKADSNAHYFEWLMAQSDPEARKSAESHLQQCKASLLALHQVHPDDPFYYMMQAFISLRHENAPAEAMEIAQQGLSLLNKQNDRSASSVFYEWKLSQIVAIVLSTTDRNEEALKVVAACKEHMEQLPADERGLAKEATLVMDWLRNGRTFDHLVWQGKITGK